MELEEDEEEIYDKLIFNWDDMLKRQVSTTWVRDKQELD